MTPSIQEPLLLQHKKYPKKFNLQFAQEIRTKNQKKINKNLKKFLDETKKIFRHRLISAQIENIFQRNNFVSNFS